MRREGAELRRLRGAVLRSTALIVALTLGAMLPSAAKIVDRIVAIVDDDIVTLGDLNKLVIDRARELEEKYGLSPKEARDRAESEREQLLNQLIEHLLLVSEARSRGISVSELELREYLDAIKAQAGITSDEEFVQQLRRQGYTLRKYRDEVRKKIMADKLLTQEVYSKIEVTDDEIDKFVSEHRDRFASLAGEKLRLRQIFIKLSFSDEEKAEARRRAKEAYKRLLSGERFEDVAKAFSDSNSIKLGLFNPQELMAINPAIYEAASKLKVGGFSKPIETPAGYHIIRLDSRSGTDIELSDIFIAYKLSPQAREELNRKVEEVLRRARAGERFEELARIYSDDEATKEEGGDLGWRSPEELDPLIRRAVERLKVGQVSEPIWTPLGVYIFKLEARETGRLSDYEREQIRNFLKERKFEEERKRFIEKLKRRHFIKVML